MRHLLRRFYPKVKPKKESVIERARRKQEDSLLARLRTAFGFGALIFQFLGFMIGIATLSLLIWLNFGK